MEVPHKIIIYYSYISEHIQYIIIHIIQFGTALYLLSMP